MKSPQHLRTDKHRHAHCCHFRIECECVWLSIDIMSKGRPHNDADDLLLCCETVSNLMGTVSLLQIQMRETCKLIKTQNEEFTKLRKRLRDSEDDDGLELFGLQWHQPVLGRAAGQGCQHRGQGRGCQHRGQGRTSRPSPPTCRPPPPPPRHRHHTTTPPHHTTTHHAAPTSQHPPPHHPPPTTARPSLRSSGDGERPLGSEFSQRMGSPTWRWGGPAE